MGISGACGSCRIDHEHNGIFEQYCGSFAPLLGICLTNLKWSFRKKKRKKVPSYMIKIGLDWLQK